MIIFIDATHSMFHQKLIGECLAGKNSSTDENYSSYYHFNPYFLNDQPNQIPATWTSQASDFESGNEWVSSDLGNGDSNRLKARCTFLVATKIANNCLLHPRSLASIWRDPSLQLSLLTVSCRYGALQEKRGLKWPQQSCYNTFTTLANFLTKIKRVRPPE